VLNNLSSDYFHLGTANFGSAYGVTNKISLPTSISDEILKWSFDKIAYVDTAIDYEGSARIIEKYANKFLINSKLTFSKTLDVSGIISKFKKYLIELGVKELDILYIRGNPFTKDGNHNSVLEFIQALKNERLIKRLGFSIYEPQELSKIRSEIDFIDVVQVPCSILNRSWSEYLEANPELSNTTTFIVRSIFMQGLLVLDKNDLLAKTKEYMPIVNSLDSLSLDLKINKLDLCIDYIRSQPWISGVVLGTNTKSQLVESLESFNRSINFYDPHWLEQVPHLDLEVMDPRKWKRTK
jgi:aryl-alcohol dehydrogenase-like predicted oxidoreductase